jgi:hypothetical protein
VLGGERWMRRLHWRLGGGSLSIVEERRERDLT